MTKPPLFDQATYLQLSAELGSEGTVEVLRLFLADTSSKMIAIASGPYSGPLIKLEGHSIKSSAATFGFSELSALARELELRAETMSPEVLSEFVEALRQAFGRVLNLAQSQLLGSGTEIA
jgi:HPt (histidine-containing phosphotransfer) domain-containing protein